MRLYEAHCYLYINCSSLTKSILGFLRFLFSWSCWLVFFLVFFLRKKYNQSNQPPNTDFFPSSSHIFLQILRKILFYFLVLFLNTLQICEVIHLSMICPSHQVFLKSHPWRTISLKNAYLCGGQLTYKLVT